MNYLDDLAAAIRSEVAPALIPKEDTTGLFRMDALLVRAKDTAVSGSDVHDAWTVWALQAKPDHSAIHPFEALDAGTQAKDEPNVDALQRVARAVGAVARA